MLKIAVALSAGAFSLYWIKYRKKIQSPPNTQVPELALVGRDKIPIIGIFFRLRDVITDPVGMISKFRTHYGDYFTIRIPFNFDLIYLCNRDAYRFIMGLDADTAMFGPILTNVPVIGFGFPRSSSSVEHLQELVLALRRFIAARFVDSNDYARSRQIERRRKPRTDSTGNRRLDQYRSSIYQTIHLHLDKWKGNHINLVPAVVDAIYDASCRCLVGDKLWDAISTEAIPLLYDISRGIEIPRVTLCKTPLFPFLAEARASKKLVRLLKKVVHQHKETSCFPFIDDIARIPIFNKDIVEDDIPWAIMYILWNAAAYPGSYGLWSLIDLVSRPEYVAKIRALHDGSSYWQFLENCFHETTRIHPLSSILRLLTQPIIYEHHGKQIYLPKNSIVGVFPYAFNRDETAFSTPDMYDPLRYEHSNCQPAIFGRGPFSCVAQNFSRVLITTVLDAIIDRFDIELISSVPERTCIVHLGYPDVPIMARINQRTVSKQSGKSMEIMFENSKCPMQ